MGHDLILRGARVIDPGSGLDRVTEVAFGGGRVAVVGDSLDTTGAEVADLPGRIVTPGLIDLHTHVYWGGTSLGIDAADFARKSGVTTCVDTGSAGPGNFAGFLRHVIEPSPVRILAYLHVSFAGIYGFSNRIMVGESHDARLMAPREAAAVVKAHPETIVGLKVRIGRHASGPSGIDPLVIAIEVAELTGLPIMCHIDEPPPSYAAVVDMLRTGDILTHCYRPFPNSPLKGNAVRPALMKARERGVLFDVGHGMGSFSWSVARGMMAAGFPPDTISSDIHALCINGPTFDQVTTLSKFLALGMPLAEVIARSTTAPAAALGRPELGRLGPEGPGDATILRLCEDGPYDLEDVEGDVLAAPQRLVAEGCIIGGRWFHRPI